MIFVWINYQRIIKEDSCGWRPCLLIWCGPALGRCRWFGCCCCPGWESLGWSLKSGLLSRNPTGRVGSGECEVGKVFRRTSFALAFSAGRAGFLPDVWGSFDWQCDRYSWWGFFLRWDEPVLFSWVTLGSHRCSKQLVHILIFRLWRWQFCWCLLCCYWWAVLFYWLKWLILCFIMRRVFPLTL